MKASSLAQYYECEGRGRDLHRAPSSAWLSLASGVLPGCESCLTKPRTSILFGGFGLGSRGGSRCLKQEYTQRVAAWQADTLGALAIRKMNVGNHAPSSSSCSPGRLAERAAAENPGQDGSALPTDAKRRWRRLSFRHPATHRQLHICGKDFFKTLGPRLLSHESPMCGWYLTRASSCIRTSKGFTTVICMKVCSGTTYLCHCHRNG